MDDDVEVLQGGIANAGAVVRVDNHVLRLLSPHAPMIHALLTHLRAVGFDAAPQVVAIEADRRERLVFIPGDVPVPPFPTWAQTDTALASVAALMRRYHDATSGFEAPTGTNSSDELADPEPGDDPVWCHNDVCLENIVFRDRQAIALLDFDFVAPGRRLWDLTAMAAMCVPLDTDTTAGLTGRSGLDPFTRLRVIADAYGLTGDERAEWPGLIAKWMERGGEFVRRHVEAGEPAFIDMWNAMGGQARYDERRRWFADNRSGFTAALA